MRSVRKPASQGQGMERKCRNNPSLGISGVLLGCLGNSDMTEDPLFHNSCCCLSKLEALHMVPLEKKGLSNGQTPVEE